MSSNSKKLSLLIVHTKKERGLFRFLEKQAQPFCRGLFVIEVILQSRNSCLLWCCYLYGPVYLNFALQVD